MEIKLMGGKLTVSHKLKRNELYQFSKNKKFQTLRIYQKPQLVKGFSNVCEDLKGILVIDYDGTDKGIVLEDWAYIQDKFNLPPAYLFTTKQRNYHVICLYKAPQPRIYEILSNTRCDVNFKSMALRNPYRSYVLRISQKEGSKKPKFLGLIGSKENLSTEVSSAHKSLLSKIYKNIEHPKYENEDHLKRIRINVYETS